MIPFGLLSLMISYASFLLYTYKCFFFTLCAYAPCKALTVPLPYSLYLNEVTKVLFSKLRLVNNTRVMCYTLYTYYLNKNVCLYLFVYIKPLANYQYK